MGYMMASVSALVISNDCLLLAEMMTTHAGPLLQKDGEHFNRHWGNLSRAGLNDKSQFTRQVYYTVTVTLYIIHLWQQYVRSHSALLEVAPCHMLLVLSLKASLQALHRILKLYPSFHYLHAALSGVFLRCAALLPVKFAKEKFRCQPQPRGRDAKSTSFHAD